MTNNEMHVWVGYGKKEQYVNATYTTDVEQFIKDSIAEIRGWGWKKQIVFKIDSSATDRKEIVIREEA